MSSSSKAHRKHAGRKRDLFPVLCIIAACVPLLFIGTAILTIIAGGITHLNEAVTSAEVLFSLRMSVVTSTISTTLCLLLALPTAFALTRTNMPFKRAAETLMQLTLSLPYILLGFALLLMFSSPAGKALKDIGFAVVFQPVGIVFAQLIVNLPFSIRMVRTAWPRRSAPARSKRSAPSSCRFAATRSSRRSCSRGRAAWASSARRSCSSA